MEEFFRRVIEHTRCAAARIRMPDRTLLYANPGFARLVGSALSSDAMIGKPLQVFVEVQPSTERLLAEVQETGRLEAREARFRTLAGEERTVIADVLMARDETTGSAVVDLLMVDVSPQRAREARLEADEQRVRTILAAIPDSMFLLRDGVFVDFSAKAHNLYVRPEDFLGRRLEAVMPPHVAAETKRLVDVAIATGEPQLQEYELEIADRTRCFEARLAPGGGSDVLVIVREITDRKAAESALAAERMRLSVTLASIADAVIATDRVGIVTLMNPVAERMTGWSSAEALGQPLTRVFRIVNEKTRVAMEDPVHTVLKTQRVVGLANDTALLSRDGSERHIAHSGAPIRSGAGAMDGVVLVFRDQTEERRLQDERIRAQKLESMGVLAGGIAHDFNNILTAVVGNVSLARMHLPPESTATPRLADAEKALSRARDLTRQLQAFSRGGQQERRISPIGPLVRDSVRIALTGSSVRAEVNEAEELWPVRVDRGQVSQVFENLLINAAQAMPGGGHIHVVLENVEVTDQWLHPVRPGRYVRVTIHDTGVGIPRANLTRIFDPYFTTKERGSGLGLAVSYSIVASHLGRMFVDSEVGTGSTFWVYLPATDGDEEIVPARPSTSVHGSGRVLVMDDDVHVRSTLKAMLADLGYEPTFAADGGAALEAYAAARERGKPFVAAVLDLTVRGGMGGRECMAALKEIDPAVKALVISGYADDPAIVQHERWGFAGAIRKPFKLEDLAEELGRVLAR